MMQLGFKHEDCDQALKENDFNMDRAIAMLV